MYFFVSRYDHILVQKKRIFRKILQFRRLTFTYLKKKKEMLVKFILG